MPRRNTIIQLSNKTAAQLAEAFAQRIVAGFYDKGDLLPSCREVARELNVDKNTANKAYKILEERGIVKAVPGKGVMVVRRPDVHSSEDSVRESINAAIWQAKAMAVEEDTLWKLIGGAIWKFYGVSELKVAYIGLDQTGASDLAKEIEDHLDLSITPIVFKDFEADPRHYVNSFDVLVTSFTYLASVNHAAEKLDATIVGVHTLPVSDDVLRIATAKKGSKIGVICSQEPNIDPLINLVKTYNPDVEFYPCLETDTEKLVNITAQVDWVVDTLTSHKFVLECCPEVPVITMTFRIEEQSIEFLKNKVLEILRQRQGIHTR
jgi:DNA-binding transcriptional regulator YhcF (GntR family)